MHNNSSSQWIEEPTPHPQFNLFSFSFPSENTGFAVGYGNRMIKTTNGGNNWFDNSIFSNTAENLNSVWFINENTGWMCSTNKILYHTTNSGLNWDSQLVLISTGNKISFLNSTTGWIQAQPYLYKTVNGGDNWSIISSGMGTEFSFVNENTGWMTTYSSGASTIHKSTNGGVNWISQYSTSNFRVIYSIKFVNENTGWAGGYREHILKTTNGGVNWFQQRDMNNSAGFFSMDFINDNTGWAIGDNAYSVYTLNGGSTWNQIPLNAGRANIKFINSQTGWVIGSKVFKTTSAGLPFTDLKLTSFIEGFYDENSNIMVPDTAKVYLRNNSPPYLIADSSTSILNQNGQGSFKFFNALNGVNYYIMIKHRNTVDVWSSFTQTFLSDTLNYNFTVSSSQAYGNNLKLKGLKWTIYSGDVDKDNTVDLNDVLISFNDADLFLTGYNVSDVNGDNLTDLSDVVLINNNAAAFIMTVSPVIP